MTRSEIRTMMKRAGFIAPKNCIHYSHTRNGRESFVPYNRMNFMKSQGANANLANRCYRVRKTDDSWVVDISCTVEKFDRWANSRYYDSVPIELFEIFCKKYLIKSKKVVENFPSYIDTIQAVLFKDFIGTDNPNFSDYKGGLDDD